MFSCASAVSVPTVMVSAASAARGSCHSSSVLPPASARKRSTSAKAAALESTATSAVTGVGAPS